MTVRSTAIERYDISEIDIRRLMKTLQLKHPHLFEGRMNSFRMLIDHGKILARTEQFSKSMKLELDVQIIPNSNPSIIYEKYRFEKEIKESTFSHTWIVRLQVFRNQNREKILSQENQR